MKYFLSLLVGFLLLVLLATPASASDVYVVENFDSKITINQDTSLTVEETIEVNFNQARHGIFRTIPVVYRAGDKVINSRLEVLSINDKYETSRQGDDIQIKIGDAQKFVTGPKTYKIVYKVKKIIQQFDGHDELYWNVAGSAWDTQILSTKVSVTSNFAEIGEFQCFSGVLRTTESKCDFNAHEKNSLTAASLVPLGEGKDMTIVVALSKNNQLNFAPSINDIVFDNWGYLISLLPFSLLLLFWFKKGRDIRYIGDDVYLTQGNKNTETTPVFNKREFLPMVYSPIAGLTPGEVGTLIDEKVDIHDVVAEIVELGRLGFLKIEKINKRFAKDDYLIIKLKTDTSALREYQKYLYDSLFSLGKESDKVKLSELKRKFYTKLNTFREKLYKHVKASGYFPSRPDHVRALWLAVAFFASGAAAVLLIWFYENTGTIWPFIILAVSSILSLLLAYQMPRKTPKGYAFYRQTKGLAFYLSKGKWREEIKEKQLFLDEILPLAISLGVVKKLAKDMEALGVKEPSYFNAHGAAWAASLSSFNSTASSSFVAGSSSGSSWSGGSGFSGGGGGGFGGGGGGSW